MEASQGSKYGALSEGNRADEDFEASTSLRIILVGKSGSGKSATGNSILCRPEFKAQVGAQYVTRQCQAARGTWNGRNILVVDTPPIFEDTPETPELYKDIGDCYLLSSPGPHVLLLVTRLGRFTAQDAEASRKVKEVFGPQAMSHVIVLFTHKEDLEGESMAQYLANVKNSELRILLGECGGRICGFNNRATGTEQRQQLEELMAQVESLERELQGGYLSSLLSQEAQLLLQQRRAGHESEDAHRRYLALVQRQVEMQRQEMTEDEGNCLRTRLRRIPAWAAYGILAFLIICFFIILAILINYAIIHRH